MNGDTDKPESNKTIIFIVVLTLGINATLGFSTLAYCIITSTKPDPVMLTGFVAIVNYVLGVLSGMLIKSSPTSSAPAENKTTGEVTVKEQQLDTK